MLGLGGGIVYIPLLVLLGVDFHSAISTSLFLVVVNSVSATSIYLRNKKIDWGLVAVLESVTAVGGLLGGFASQLLPEKVLAVLFVAVVALAGVLMLRQSAPPPVADAVEVRWHWARRAGAVQYAVPLHFVLPICFAVGMLSNLVGIGGGVLIVPTLVLLAHVPMDIAVGSSALMVGLTALTGLFAHAAAGQYDLRTWLVLGPAVVLGSQIGAHLSVRIDKQRLRKIFAVSTIVIALIMLAKIFSGR